MMATQTTPWNRSALSVRRLGATSPDVGLRHAVSATGTELASPAATSPGGIIIPRQTRMVPATTTASREPSEAAPKSNVVRLPQPTPLEYRFELLQQWEGVVTGIEGDEFSVTLRDTLDRKAPEYDAVLPLDEVIEDDRPLLEEGAVLYWTIGYEQTRTGQRKRVSTIRLRRLPSWTRADIDRVRQEAQELDSLFASE